MSPYFHLISCLLSVDSESFSSDSVSLFMTMRYFSISFIDNYLYHFL